MSFKSIYKLLIKYYAKIFYLFTVIVIYFTYYGIHPTSSLSFPKPSREFSDGGRREIIRSSYPDGKPFELNEKYDGRIVKIQAWNHSGCLVMDETYENEKLMSGRYYDGSGNLLGEVIQGTGKQIAMTVKLNDDPKVTGFKEYKNGVPHGREELGATRDRRLVAEYRDGWPDGKILISAPSGRKIFEAVYAQGRPHGEVIHYYDNGNTNSVLLFDEPAMFQNKDACDVEDWYWFIPIRYAFYSEHGELKSIGTCTDWHQSDETYQYYKNGNTMSVFYTFNRELPLDIPKAMRKDSRIVNNAAESLRIIKGLPDRSVFYYENGAICSDTEYNNRYRKWHQNGQLMSDLVSRTGGGIVHGVSFDPQGRSSGVVENGNGIIVDRMNPGDKLGITFYKNGRHDRHYKLPYLSSSTSYSAEKRELRVQLSICQQEDVETGSLSVRLWVPEGFRIIGKSEFRLDRLSSGYQVDLGTCEIITPQPIRNLDCQLTADIELAIDGVQTRYTIDWLKLEPLVNSKLPALSSKPKSSSTVAQVNKETEHTQRSFELTGLFKDDHIGSPIIAGRSSPYAHSVISVLGKYRTTNGATLNDATVETNPQGTIESVLNGFFRSKEVDLLILYNDPPLLIASADKGITWFIRRDKFTYIPKSLCFDKANRLTLFCLGTTETPECGIPYMLEESVDWGVTWKKSPLPSVDYLLGGSELIIGKRLPPGGLPKGMDWFELPIIAFVRQGDSIVEMPSPNLISGTSQPVKKVRAEKPLSNGHVPTAYLFSEGFVDPYYAVYISLSQDQIPYKCFGFPEPCELEWSENSRLFFVKNQGGYFGWHDVVTGTKEIVDVSWANHTQKDRDECASMNEKINKMKH